MNPEYDYKRLDLFQMYIDCQILNFRLLWKIRYYSKDINT